MIYGNHVSAVVIALLFLYCAKLSYLTLFYAVQFYCALKY